MHEVMIEVWVFGLTKLCTRLRLQHQKSAQYCTKGRQLACFGGFKGNFSQKWLLKLKQKAYLLCNVNHFRATQIMQKPGEILEQIQRIAGDMQNKVSDAIRNSPAQEIEKNMRAMMNQGFQKMDLVTREEFEVQSKVLAKTREKLEVLEVKVAALEKSIT